MALVYEAGDALSQFNFIQFKTVMNIADIDEPSYAIILKAVFDNLLTQYEIDIDTLEVLTYDLVFAIFRHAKFIFEVHHKNLDVIEKTSDASGNKTTFKITVPKEVMATYKMYSPVAPAIL